MAFCPGCGCPVADNDSFCRNCGRSLSQNNVDISYHNREIFLNDKFNCPKCGAELKSMNAICPYCGHEFNAKNTTSVISVFSNGIQQYDASIANEGPKARGGWSSWPIIVKIVWALLNMYSLFIPYIIYALCRPFAKTLSAKEREKQIFIENYVFPNDRETLLEALIFIKNQLSNLAIGIISDNEYYWGKVWMKKAEEIHQKSEIVMRGDEISKKTFEEITKYNSTIKKKLLIRRLIFVVLAIFVIMILFILPLFRH